VPDEKGHHGKLFGLVLRGCELCDLPISGNLVIIAFNLIAMIFPFILVFDAQTKYGTGS
jgi:hypothetical protein